MKTNKSTFSKYISILLCASMLIFSCSKNNENGPDNPAGEKTELILRASDTEVEKGDEVTFEVKTENEVISADIYINEVKIGGNTHVFENAGTYSVVAKKEGFLDSDTKTLKVFQIDVYIAGNNKVGGKSLATYWKNGVPVALNDGTSDAMATAIVVSGGDVYVAGNDNDGTGGDAVYWKNGTKVALPVTSEYGGAYARSIAVENGNVYVCGEQVKLGASAPSYWKNGTLTQLSDYGRANDITVFNGETHVVGEGYKHPDKLARYWKNGNLTLLTNGDQNSIADAVTVDNGDVYIAGFQYNSYGYRVTDSNIKYWKNSTPVTIGENEIPTGIVVDNGDVYISSNNYTHKTVAKYYKNGTAEILSNKNYNATANSIAVWNSNVYVVGVENNKPVYWKNGTPIPIEATGATLRSIFVVKSTGE